MIEFFVPGEPEALKRHRYVQRGTRITNYDPSAAAKESFLVQAMAHKPDVPITEPVALYLTLYFLRPKSHYNSKGLLRSSAPKYHTSKPDASNVQKFVEDALDGVFWRDDSIICRWSGQKVYSETPGVQVHIVPADAEYFGITPKEEK